MFPRPNARHSQIAYVTNDLERALAVWRDEFDVPAFHVFTNDMPGLESSHPCAFTMSPCGSKAGWPISRRIWLR